MATVAAVNTFVAGQFVVLQGFANAAATVFNGRIVQIASATAALYTFAKGLGAVQVAKNERNAPKVAA